MLQSEEKRLFAGIGDLPSVEDVLTGDLAVRGDWHVANVVGAPYWTVRMQTVQFRGMDVHILPHTREGTYPALAARRRPDQTDEDVRRILSGFLSSLCWTLGGGALVHHWTGGSRPFALGGFSDRITRTLAFDIDYLPDPADTKGRLALALCREAGALNTASHAVISYFRVFETHFQGQAREIKDWINNNYEAVTDFTSKEALQRLRASQSDVGAYLYDSCRSAAAHGKVGKAVVIDPDDPSDERRLNAELPLIRALAIKLTEEILGVQTSSTIYREHLYELSGFKAIIGDSNVAKLSRGEPLDEGIEIDIPPLNFGLMERQVFPALCGLQVSELGQTPGALHMKLVSPNGLVQIAISLQFQEERLQFDSDFGIGVHDDDSPGAARAFADVTEFLKWYFLNGRLKITHAQTGDLIGRKDPFLPLNVMVDPLAFDKKVQQWNGEAAAREAKSNAPDVSPSS